jgi:SNF2 family DNA or RNA helicase
MDLAPCPLCRRVIKGSQLKRVANPGTIDDNDDDDDEDMLAAKKAKLAEDSGHTVFDAKFQVLVELLEQVRAEDETSKVLIFSQFGGTITMLQSILPQYGYQCRTLTGDMDRSRRDKALRDFQNDPSTTVFLSKCFGGYTFGSGLDFCV